MPLPWPLVPPTPTGGDEAGMTPLVTDGVPDDGNGCGGGGGGSWPLIGK